MIAAIILAAGASERMGAPKADLLYRGRTFLQATLEASAASGLSPLCAVVDGSRRIVFSDNSLRSVVIIRNPHAATGPIGSAILGIHALVNHPVEAALFWHVDRPHVRVGTLQALADRFRAGGCAIVVPELGGRRGHPIILSREVFPEVLANPADGMRAVVRAFPERVGVVEVQDPAVLEDIDTPEDYEALIRGEGLR